MKKKNANCKKKTVKCEEEEVEEHEEHEEHEEEVVVQGEQPGTKSE